MTINDMRRRGKIGRSTLYREISAHRLRTFTRGRRRLALETDFERWLASYCAVIG